MVGKLDSRELSGGTPLTHAPRILLPEAQRVSPGLEPWETVFSTEPFWFLHETEQPQTHQTGMPVPPWVGQVTLLTCTRPHLSKGQRAICRSCHWLPSLPCEVTFSFNGNPCVVTANVARACHGEPPNPCERQ